MSVINYKLYVPGAETEKGKCVVNKEILTLRMPGKN